VAKIAYCGIKKNLRVSSLNTQKLSTISAAEIEWLRAD